MGWACAHQAVIDHGDQLIAADKRVERTVAVGVDEHTFQHANARRRTQMATTFVGIDRARLLDVVPGRSGDLVRDWLNERPDGWAERIEVAMVAVAVTHTHDEERCGGGDDRDPFDRHSCVIAGQPRWLPPDIVPRRPHC